MPEQLTENRDAEVHTPYPRNDDEAPSSCKTEDSKVSSTSDANEGALVVLMVLDIPDEIPEQEVIAISFEAEATTCLLPQGVFSSRQESPTEDETDEGTVEEVGTKPTEETILVCPIVVRNRPRSGSGTSSAKATGCQIQCWMRLAWSIQP
ncbi:hypothetical protein PMIN06_011625 [Paraphaeosphaeria minitans]|uniref:Uncharacterized protein n=1 Tax=Paraphaeosphaeria minitans TaxID=565426 RepID=A0A9P6G6T9_9PLEO|nr:hypothetical protein PMIN01_11845 [Paraphaeosphaeria minitans]